eukprot:CFRG6986T1
MSAVSSSTVQTAGGAVVSGAKQVRIEWDFTLQLAGFCLAVGSFSGFVGGYRLATMMYATPEQEKKVWGVIKRTAFAAFTLVAVTTVAVGNVVGKRKAN